MTHQAGAYPSFRNMKRLGVFQFHPVWNASPLQSYPQQQICRYPFIHLGGERHCESKESCLSSQHNDPGQGSHPALSIWNPALLLTTSSPNDFINKNWINYPRTFVESYTVDGNQPRSQGFSLGDLERSKSPREKTWERGWIGI